MKKIVLAGDQVDRLLDLLRDQRAGVASGDITGYGQPQSDELADIDELISDLED